MYGAHKGSTDSSQYIPDTLRNIVTSWYSQRHSVINHCYRHITLLSDTDISFGLLNLFTYFDAFWVIISNTLFDVKEILKIYLIEQKIYSNHQDERFIMV